MVKTGFQIKYRQQIKNELENNKIFECRTYI